MIDRHTTATRESMRPRRRVTARPASLTALTTLTALAAIAALAACADAPTSPSPAGAAAAGQLVSVYSSAGTADTTRATIYVAPDADATYLLGDGHKISFPARAICDPRTAGYGPLVWDDPCKPTKQVTAITATSWRDASGHPHVDFTPALRFSPKSVVSLYLLDRAASRDPSATINYCPIDEVCYDESLLDPSLPTRKDLKNGYVYRRIKHFSGYNVAGRAGEAEEY